MIDQDNDRVIDETAKRVPAHRGSARLRPMKALGEPRATDTLGQAPLIALAGGIAAGALIAALLPRTRRRPAWFGPLPGE